MIVRMNTLNIHAFFFLKYDLCIIWVTMQPFEKNNLYVYTHIFRKIFILSGKSKLTFQHTLLQELRISGG